jgi:hypothetical protein
MMEPDKPYPDGESALHNPVVIITNELMEAYYEEMRLNPPIPPDGFISPFSDESVQGYVTDRQPRQAGVEEMVRVVKMLEDVGVSCCLVAEAALIYYGTGRVKSVCNQALDFSAEDSSLLSWQEWTMCVPTHLLEKAANLFKAQKDDFEAFRPCALTRFGRMDHLYPRFKFVGLGLFFILIPSQACHVSCEPNNIEYSHTGLPYPKLHIFAQSLIDTGGFVDLDDLVDGMNLTLEWGEANLDLEGTIDAEWGRWKADALHNGKATEDQIPVWCSNPEKRRDIWEKVVSDQAKRDRQRHKFHPTMETRFWRRGQKDPRLRKREYC